MKTKSEVIKLLKEGYKIFVDCEDETGILYSIFKENGLYNPFKIEKGMCYYITKSLPVNIKVTEFQNDYKTINLSEIEPDNEKTYLFYEGEKYYFGEEYEFSDDEKIYVTCVFTHFDTEDERKFYGASKEDSGYFRYIRKIDHTSKYKKQLEELKKQAEKDGVNLKELI